METIRVVTININARDLFPNRMGKYFKVVMQLTKAVRVVDCDGEMAEFFDDDVDSFQWTDQEWHRYCCEGNE